MTEFEAVIASYKQANVQYTMFECANVQIILTPYINYTMVMTFCDYEKMAHVELESMPLNEIVALLTNMGWKVCA